MKKLLLSAVLVTATIIAFAQTYQEHETPYGKNYLIKHKDGKFSSVHFSSSNGDAQSKILFSDPAFHKEREKESIKNTNLKNKETHHLTLHFDKEMSMSSLIITSDSNSYSEYNLSWSADWQTGEIDLPGNNYEIMALNESFIGPGIFDDSYVFFHNLSITEDMDTTISFEAMANHKIFLRCKDENDSLLTFNDTSLISNIYSINVKFPLTCIFNSFTAVTRLPNGYFSISDMDTEYGITVNHWCTTRRNGTIMYITDLGQLEGVTKDTLLQNNPSDYKKMDMVMHASLSSSQNNYLTFSYGTRERLMDGGYYYSYFSELGTNFPSFDKDTLQVFMANKENQGNGNYMTSFVSQVCFWEDMPSFWSSKCYTSKPFFVTSKDSIDFELFNVSAASPQFPDNSIVDLGNTAPYINFYGKNNTQGVNTIYSYNTTYGQINEERQMDNYVSPYEIRKENEVLVSDTLSNFTAPFSVTEPGIYTFAVKNNNYTVNEQLGSASMESTFDLSKTDANSPAITSFKLLNADNLISNTFEFDEPGKLLFSAYDWDFSTYQMNAPASVQTFFKKYDETDWTELNVTEHPNLFDSIGYGSFYTCDLAPAFSQFSTSGYLDIKIVAFDSTGNSTAHTWHPVAYVENTVGIPQIVSQGEETLQVYPNPVKDVLTVKYSGNMSYSINILNTLGNTVYNSPVTGSKIENINLKSLNLSDGIYIIQLIGNNKNVVYKKIIYKN